MDAAHHDPFTPAADLRTVVAGLSELGEVERKPMFGALGLTVRGVLVALWRDEQLYVRAPSGPETAAFRPYRGRRLSLGFYKADALVLHWLELARAAAEEVEELAARVPANPSFGAYRRD